MELNLALRWEVTENGVSNQLDAKVFELLREIRQGGHLNYAAKAVGVSYRHGWGVIREWEERFGTALIIARRGRGAHLTEFAESLLTLAGDVESSLAPSLEKISLEGSARLSLALEQRRNKLTLATSHNDILAALRAELDHSHHVTVEVSGSEKALLHYQRGDADIVGFHLPLGELGRRVCPRLIQLLDPQRDQIRLLGQGTLGLVSRQEHAVALTSELLTNKLRLVNRQPGSATRLIFDAMIAHEHIATRDIRGYDFEEHSHTAVAAMVASSAADVGFANAAAAAMFKLHFTPLVQERYYVAMPRDGDSMVRNLIAEFSDNQQFESQGKMKSDEVAPSVAALKRVHNAGFWKDNQRTD